MTGQTSYRKRFFVFLLFIVLFLLLIPITLLYSTGYRFEKGFNILPTGGIYVYYPESGVDVTIKGMPPQRTSFFSRSVLIQNLDPGTYEIDVSKPNYSYWKKDILIQERKVTEAYPFLVLEPLATSTVPISLRTIVQNLFNSTSTIQIASNINSIYSTSTVDLTKGVLNRDIYLYKKSDKIGDSLEAMWIGQTIDSPLYFCGEVSNLCDSTTEVTVSKTPINHFDFYPGRNDVIIYSNNDGVFVTELDKRGGQNFVTLAKGKVDFRVYNGHIYIKDKNITYEVIYS